MTADIYIVDDDRAVRDSLTILFEAHGYQTHLYSDGEAFLNDDLSKISGPVLLDVRMPGRNGIEILSEALSQNPHIPIIIMSGHGDIPMAVRALKKGAKTFIEKPFKAANIFAEISTLHQQIVAAETQKAKLSKLTAREREVMQHLVEGKPNKIIAADLGLSIRTIETHRARLLSKLDIRSLSDLVRISMTGS